MPTDVDDEILCAVSRALTTHGYADLTMQDIADEYSKSKAALHYHYDSKRDLLVAFQAYIGERFLTRLREAVDPHDDPAAQLAAVLDAALSPPETDDLEDLQTALLELKAQAPYEERYRDQIDEFDEQLTDLLAGILADGVESGTFRQDLDPAETARFVITVLEGYQVRHVSVGQSAETTRDLLETHLERHVYAGPDGRTDEVGSQ